MSSRSLPFHIHICEAPEYKVPATETLCVRSPHCEQLSVANKAEAAQQPKITLHACHFRVGQVVQDNIQIFFSSVNVLFITNEKTDIFHSSYSCCHSHRKQL